MRMLIDAAQMADRDRFGAGETKCRVGRDRIAFHDHIGIRKRAS
jgi:hypothetical protein